MQPCRHESSTTKSNGSRLKMQSPQSRCTVSLYTCAPAATTLACRASTHLIENCQCECHPEGPPLLPPSHHPDICQQVDGCPECADAMVVNLRRRPYDGPGSMVKVSSVSTPRRNKHVFSVALSLLTCESVACLPVGDQVNQDHNLMQHAAPPISMQQRIWLAMARCRMACP